MESSRITVCRRRFKTEEQLCPANGANLLPGPEGMAFRCARGNAIPVLLKKSGLAFLHRNVSGFLDQIFVLGKQWLLSFLAGAPDWVGQIASSLLNISALLAVFLTLFALMSLFERKILARIQNRYGPNRVGPFGLLQPVADGIKMLIKEDIVPARADKVVHFLAPILIAAAAILALGIIPYGRNMTPFTIDGGILFFFAVGSTNEVGVFMAGWGSNNKFSMLGAMRAIAQMVSYELPLIITVLPVVMVTGSLTPDAIVAAQGGYSLGILPHWFVFTPWGAVAFILFFVSGLVESNRTPFDVPEGESEIVAGHMTEYSGFKYAIFFLAEYFGMFAVSGLAVTLFLGGWHAPFSVLQFVPSYLWFFLKLGVLLFVFIWIRGTLPRIRVDQMMSFAWKFMLPMAFTCVIAAAIWHYQGRRLSGSLWSLGWIVLVYLTLSRVLGVGKKFAPRTYRFAE
jgi:NADH-quinone oxidoreductase subunit H